MALAIASPASPVFANNNADRDHRHRDDGLRKVADGFQSPRGVATLGDGATLVTEQDGTFNLVVERRRHRAARVIKLGRVPTRFAPAIDTGPRRTVFILATGADLGGKRNAARLFKWRPGWRKARQVANIGAYQRRDPDPYDLERKPRESNPYGLAALDDGSVLVVDPAGNDLLRVERDGDIETVARFKPRKVKVPRGLGKRDAEGKRLPRAGTKVRSESVPTSVTVGDDGHWYVGELRGWPATPKTSQIWRIRPGSRNAVCDPKAPDDRRCQRYADGLTSIVDLATGDDDTLYALSLSKKGWLRMEMGGRRAQIGGLFEIKRVDDRWHGRDHRRDRDWDRDWDRNGNRDWSRDGDRSWDRNGNRQDRNGDWRHRDRCDHDSWRDRWDDRRWDDRRWDDDWRRDGRDGHDRWNDRKRDDWRDDCRDRGRDWSRDHNRRRHDDGFEVRIRELVRGQLVRPGGVDVDEDDGDIYLVGPLFDRNGALKKLED